MVAGFGDRAVSSMRHPENISGSTVKAEEAVRDGTSEAVVTPRTSARGYAVASGRRYDVLLTSATGCAAGVVVESGQTDSPLPRQTVR